MQLRARASLPNTMVAIVVDGSTVVAVNAHDSVERLAECLVLLHEHQGGPLLRAELKFVPPQSPFIRTASANPDAKEPPIVTESR